MDGEKRIRNHSIDYFKYFCSLLVMVIHVKPFLAISERANTIAIGVLPRIAVPFFFVVSGYFFAEKLYAGKKPLKKFALKIITVYTFWSLVYAARLIFIEVINHRFKLSFFYKLAIQYIFYGVSEHLWYCLSLLFAVCVLTLLHKLKLQKLIPVIFAVIWILSVLIITYYGKFAYRIPLIRAFRSLRDFLEWFRLIFFGTGFVLMGDIIFSNKDRLLRSEKKIYIFTGVFITLYLAEKLINVLWGNYLLINVMLYPMTMFIFLFLLKRPSSKGTFFSPYARNAATFTYYSHPFFMSLIGQVVHYRPMLYVFVMIVTLALSVLITKINNKRLNYLMI